LCSPASEIALVAIAGVLALLRGRCLVPVNAVQEVSKREPRRAAVEGKFINSVCGIAVSTDYPMRIEKVAGVSYHFCCDGCRTTFQKEPAKFAEIHHTSTGRVAA